MTGAPKIRAMEIIAELEPHGRGPYAGAVGYIGSGGVLDTAIALRTRRRRRRPRVPAGGGRDRRRLDAATRRPARSTTSWPQRWTRSRASAAGERARRRAARARRGRRQLRLVHVQPRAVPRRARRRHRGRAQRRAEQRRGRSPREPAAIVLSPGSGTARRMPASASTWCATPRARRCPLLGVCLGHQAIGLAFGGRVVNAARIMHGKRSDIEHTGDGVFAGLPNPLRATRYHSLVVERATPARRAGASRRGRRTAR